MSLIPEIDFLLYFMQVLTYNGLGKTKKPSFITDVSISTIYRLVYTETPILWPPHAELTRWKRP